MQTMMDLSFNDKVEAYLKKRLPPQMAASVSLPGLPQETRNFVERMLALMKEAGYRATDLNPPLFRWLTTTIPSILPDAWGGRIPPLTLPGRHKKLDHYVNGLKWKTDDKPPTLLDVGCGFPPVTTADTARELTNWRVFGVDRSFADYVLYDPDGHYACFDKDGVFQYFQALMNASGRDLYANPDATRNRFNSLFGELSPLIRNPDDAVSTTVESDGNTLIHNHVRDFEAPNLTFIEADINTLKLPTVKVIRCMNLLLYFDTEARAEMLRQMGRLLDADGILIAGTNGLGIQTRYLVYRKQKSGLLAEEFAFSLDNIGHISFMPWFTLHDPDPEALLLAQLAGTIRSDRSFWPAFSSRLDALLQEHDICSRGADGYLHFHHEDMPPSAYLEINARIWHQIVSEGFIENAVGVLEKAGYAAWQNSVGDLAVRPPTASL